MENTGMLYILPTIVLQVEAYLYYETINKNILSFYVVLFLFTRWKVNHLNIQKWTIKLRAVAGPDEMEKSDS